MSKLISIGTFLPEHKIAQKDILAFMLGVYSPPAEDRKRIELLYNRSAIDYRYSVVPDYASDISKREFYPQTRNLEPFPSLEKRMEWYHPHALKLSAGAIKKCIAGKIELHEITHLITVSCTGMSAPGLDLALLEELGLNHDIYRTSVNFMGCYAAVHGLKIADGICKSEPQAKVIVVCTEICTLHFQKDLEMDSVASSLLFGDGAVAALVTHDSDPGKGLHIKGFYSEVKLQGKKDMAWHLSSKGFLMTLSAYIPDLLKEDIKTLAQKALKKHGVENNAVSHWAIHPGGKKILETFSKELGLKEDDLRFSYKVLKNYGNMSSPTVLFVLKEIMDELDPEKNSTVFSAAFGPGLTMETVLFTTVA
ncbi:MAG: type III polyketide synthase [Bacteroidia bacterium]